MASDVEGFAIAFAMAVTEVSDPESHFVAKNGKHSIYSVLQELFPQASGIICMGCYSHFLVNDQRSRNVINLISAVTTS
jgi:hypothetical protein